MIKLYDVLREAGHEPVVIRDKVMVLPFSGRVIGLYPGDKNIFWVNENLLTVEKALKFFDNPGWINIGGDRAWISPEIETHIDDPKKYPESIKVPKKIDPGAYEVREADSKFGMFTKPHESAFSPERKDCSVKPDKTYRIY